MTFTNTWQAASFYPQIIMLLHIGKILTAAAEF